MTNDILLFIQLNVEKTLHFALVFQVAKHGGLRGVGRALVRVVIVVYFVKIQRHCRGGHLLDGNILVSQIRAREPLSREVLSTHGDIPHWTRIGRAPGSLSQWALVGRIMGRFSLLVRHDLSGLEVTVHA